MTLGLDTAGGGETTCGGTVGGGDEGVVCFEGDAPELDKFSKAKREFDAMMDDAALSVRLQSERTGQSDDLTGRWSIPATKGDPDLMAGWMLRRNGKKKRRRAQP